MCCWADVVFPFFLFFFFFCFSLEPMLGSQGAAQEGQDAVTMEQLKVGVTGL